MALSRITKSLASLALLFGVVQGIFAAAPYSETDQSSTGDDSKAADDRKSIVVYLLTPQTSSP